MDVGKIFLTSGFCIADHWLLMAYNNQWCYLRGIIQANVVIQQLW